MLKLSWPLTSRHALFWFCTVTSVSVALALSWIARTEAHVHHKAEVKSQQIRVRVIPDVQLTDQNGQQVRFTSDVVRQRTALVSFIYTSCTTTCPLVGATVAAVTDHLKNDARNLAIISISVDPDYDTPDRLLAWRERYGDIPQWTLLTGPKREIFQLLRALGAYSPNLEEHSEIVLVGPDAAGQWTRMSSLAAWNDVAAAVRAATVPARGN